MQTNHDILTEIQSTTGIIVETLIILYPVTSQKPIPVLKEIRINTEQVS